MEKLYSIHMGKAKCAIDLGDGSERGEYVNQDYILHTLGRPMRSIGIMYCYYPLDETWPQRASVAYADKKVGFQWDYPYDDYFPYEGGLGGNKDGQPFQQMRDIRRHGQDVTLTLTIDPNVSDEHIIAIAKDLRPFGRVLLRINHEATGNWFSFTKRTSYQGVADFFVHATQLIHEYAPNVEVVICAGGVEHENDTEMHMEKEFAQTILAADVWSIDKYMALHWGWPYDVAEPGGNSHSRSKVRDVYDMTKRTYEHYVKLNGGKAKPMTMAEFNADGDVTGAYDQAAMLQEFCDYLEEDNADWFTAYTFYQFRDRGRLGLEIEDPNNPEVGIAQPVMDTFKKLITQDRYLPRIAQGEELQLPVTLQWTSSEDASGIAIPIHFKGNPVFCEIIFEDDGNYMIELHGKWFYKSPKAKTIDMMSAFYHNPLEEACDMTLKLFAPPHDGVNNTSTPESMRTYTATMEKMPKVRILYTPVEP